MPQSTTLSPQAGKRPPGVAASRLLPVLHGEKVRQGMRGSVDADKKGDPDGR